MNYHHRSAALTNPLMFVVMEPITNHTVCMSSDCKLDTLFCVFPSTRSPIRNPFPDLSSPSIILQASWIHWQHPNAFQPPPMRHLRASLDMPPACPSRLAPTLTLLCIVAHTCCTVMSSCAADWLPFSRLLLVLFIAMGSRFFFSFSSYCICSMMSPPTSLLTRHQIFHLTILTQDS